MTRSDYLNFHSHEFDHSHINRGDIGSIGNSSFTIEGSLKGDTGSAGVKSSQKTIDPRTLFIELQAELTHKVSILEASTEEKLKKIELKQNFFDDKQKEAEDNLQSSQSKVTETLAVFVSLFTFVSVSFQIFSKANNLPQVIGIVLILIGALILFNILLHILMRPTNRESVYTKDFFVNGNFWKELWEQFKLSILNGGMAIILLILSLILIATGVIITSKYSDLGSNSDNTKDQPQITNNNSVKIVNESTPSAIQKKQ